MRRKLGAGTAATVVVAVAVGVTALPSAGQEPPPPIAAEPLTGRAVFPDDVDLKLKIKPDGKDTAVVNVEEPSRTVVVRYTVQPGAQFPWHSHAGPVVVNIVSGALTYIDAETCTDRTYTRGQAFVDPGQGHVHSAFNATSSPTVLVATFFDAPAEGSLLIPAAPGDC
ncbi:MAG TPA: cupin domain-containing protein [Gaiellaceae bacterium]|nr:cupin domain-containing protein [Gaiellaceae bacterium]